MEVLKLKKGMMQVAKVVSVLILLSFPLFAQETMIGVYSDIEGQGRRILELKNGNVFNENTASLFSHSSFISRGYYLVIKDTLFLFYDSLPSANPPSIYTVQEKSDSIFHEFGGGYKINDDVASLTITVEDYSGNPIRGCNVGFMKSNKPVFGRTCDKNGKVEVYTEGKLIEYISIFGLGYKPIWISMNELWGFKSSIKVELSLESNFSYNHKYKIVKYSINKKKKNKLLLVSINNPNKKLIRKHKEK